MMKILNQSWSLVSFVFCVVLSIPVFAFWDVEKTLLDTNEYTEAQGARKFISVTYSIRDARPQYQIPVSPVMPGGTLRIKVIAPPGAIEVTLSGESGQLQGLEEGFPIMAGFSEDKGDFCQYSPTSANLTPCGAGRFIYPSDLQSSTARANRSLYAGPKLENVRYVYFVLYQQGMAIDSFRFASLTVDIAIDSSDGKYNEWIRAGHPLPGESPQPLKFLVKVEVLDNVGDWYKIKIANGSIGWILDGDFRKI